MYKIIIFLLSFFPFISCASGSDNARSFDLKSKGLIKVSLIITVDGSFQKFIPTRIYFKKLDEPSDLANGKIIFTEVLDQDDNFVINSDPGTYVVIASARSASTGKVVDVFSEDIINKSKVELKAGDTISIKKIYALEKNSSELLGTISDLMNHHREIIGENLKMLSANFRIANLDKSMYIKDRKEEKNESEKKQIDKIEEYK